MTEKTMAERYRELRDSRDYVSLVEFAEMIEEVDSECVVTRNEAGNVVFLFSDGSTQVLGRGLHS